MSIYNDLRQGLQEAIDYAEVRGTGKEIKMCQYPAIFWTEKDGNYWVFIPDVYTMTPLETKTEKEAIEKTKLLISKIMSMRVKPGFPETRFPGLLERGIEAVINITIE